MTIGGDWSDGDLIFVGGTMSDAGTPVGPLRVRLIAAGGRDASPTASRVLSSFVSPAKPFVVSVVARFMGDAKQGSGECV